MVRFAGYRGSSMACKLIGSKLNRSDQAKQRNVIETDLLEMWNNSGTFQLHMHPVAGQFCKRTKLSNYIYVSYTEPNP